MKKLIFLLTALIGFSAYSQNSSLSLNGGYAFGKIENSDASATGFRISGVYEMRAAGSKFAHGLSFGYMNLTGQTSNATGTTDWTIGTFPFLYAPKFFFGGKKMEGTLKGAAGWQFSNVKREGSAGGIQKTADGGFSLGAGAGGHYHINKNVFINLEYEFLWLGNSFYRDGFINTVSTGIGLQF
jgi:opacity protein-like surface antigen